MAYRLVGVGNPPEKWGSLIDGDLSCYDTIGDTAFDLSRDELLHERSSYEFIRDQLTPEQGDELDQVDAYWKAHPKEFNADFAVIHFQEDKAIALKGFVEDDKGETPAIPRSHWWWYPIEHLPSGKEK